METRPECRDFFFAGAGRAARFWLAYVRRCEADHGAIDSELDNILQALAACQPHATLWPSAVELALLLHPHMINSGQWARWERPLAYLLSREGPGTDRLTGGLLQRALAETYGREGQLARAADCAAHAAAACRQAGARQPMARCLADLAHWHIEQGHYEETMALALEAEAACGCDGDPSVRADVLILQARIALHRHEVGQAMERYGLALHTAAVAQDRGRVKSASNFLGLALIQAGRFSESLPHLAQALELARQAGDRPGQGVILSSTGAAYLGMGRLDEARASLETALDITRQTDNRRAEVVILLRLGRVHRAAGCPDLALGYFRDALELAQALGEQAREVEIQQEMEQTAGHNPA